MSGEIIDKTECRITEEAVCSSATNVIPAGNVVIATRVGLGKVCLLAQDTAINQDLRGVVPRGDVLRVSFLYHWFRFIAPEIVKAGTGATVQGVKLPFIKSLLIPLPSLREQERIVAILDQAFAAINTTIINTEKNLQNTRILFHSPFEALVSEAEQEHWSKTTVTDLAIYRKNAIRTGPFGSQLLHAEFVEDGIAVLGIDNVVTNKFCWGKRRFITSDKYRQLERYRIHPGDVLISIMGTCGRCAIVPDDIPVAINTKHLCCITLDRSKCLPSYLHAYFLYHTLAQDFLARRAKGSIMAGLNMGIIQVLPVLLPTITRQAELITDFDLLKLEIHRVETALKAKLAALAALKQSLLHQAFSGNL